MPRVRNHFYYSYMGSKTSEIPQFNDYLPTDRNVTIVEPFAGSAAVSYHLWCNGFRDIHISDRDPFLVELWRRVRDPEERGRLIDEATAAVAAIDSRESYKELIRSNTFISQLIGSTWYNFRRNVAPLSFDRKPDFTEIFNRNYTNFISDIHPEECDFIDMCERHRNDPNAFIFIDPPYVNEDNNFYYNEGSILDLEAMYTYLLDLLNSPCKVLIIVSDKLLMKLLFKEYIKGIYPKKYEFSKKKVNHLIIANWDLT